MTDRARAELAMPPDPTAPAYVRQWLRDMLRGSGLPSDVLHDALVIVDELVTTSVVHAATPIVVTLEYSPDACRCSVRDRCTSGPLPRLIERADGTGRGLRLVNAIATAWGVDRSESGTMVWAEIGAPA